MNTLKLSPIPSDLQWKNDPIEWAVSADHSLSMTAGAKSDWFIEPSGSDWVTSNAPIALFTPSTENFMLSAKVTVNFASTFDAGVLFLYAGDDLWAKLCFEYSPLKQPMIVSVVTRGFSDDCNSTVIDGNTVYLRVAQMGKALGFHYSLDGTYWNMVRYFTLGNIENLRIGFGVQSPTGDGCKATFSDIAYRTDRLKDMRSGE